MSTGSKHEWPYVPPRTKRAGTMAHWDEDVPPAVDDATWARWGVIGIVAAAAAITVLSSIAVAALHEDGARMSKRASAEPRSASGKKDSHLQELVREHHRALFGS